MARAEPARGTPGEEVEKASSAPSSPLRRFRDGRSGTGSGSTGSVATSRSVGTPGGPAAAGRHGSASPVSQAGPRPPGERPRKRKPHCAQPTRPGRSPRHARKLEHDQRAGDRADHPHEGRQQADPSGIGAAASRTGTPRPRCRRSGAATTTGFCTEDIWRAHGLAPRGSRRRQRTGRSSRRWSAPMHNAHCKQQRCREDQVLKRLPPTAAETTARKR